MRYVAARSCLMLLLIALAGCAGRKDCDACSASAPAHPYPCDASVLSSPPNSFYSPAPIDMLFLSGGGSHGAFGAGVLYGWSGVSGADARPNEFAVVTGVSAGALQATWAFLGKSYDAELYRYHTTLDDDRVYKNRPGIALLWASSVRTAEGLKNIIEQAFPAALIDKVGQQSGKRLLCVGTVNLDSGKFVAWNMTAIAADTTNPKRVQLYQDVLRASASVPLIFPPVKIGKTLYVDGGLREEIFGGALIKEIETWRDNFSTRPAGQKDRAYVVTNMGLSVSPQCVQPRIPAVAERTVEVMLSEGHYGSVYRALHELGNKSSDLDIRYRYIPTNPPANYPIGLRPDTFDRDRMCRLFCKGYKESGEPWATDLPLNPDPLPAPSCGDSLLPAGDTLSDSDCPGTGPVCPP